MFIDALYPTPVMKMTARIVVILGYIMDMLWLVVNQWAWVFYIHLSCVDCVGLAQQVFKRVQRSNPHHHHYQSNAFSKVGLKFFSYFFSHSQKRMYVNCIHKWYYIPLKMIPIFSCRLMFQISSRCITAVPGHTPVDQLWMNGAVTNGRMTQTAISE